MHMLAQLPKGFWPIVVGLLFAVVLVVFMSYADAYAKGGWSSFAKRYRARTRPPGESYRVPSWTYCNVHWNARGLRVIFNEVGIYFYLPFYRSLAHPPFLLPWGSVKGVKKERGFMGEYLALEIEDTAGKLKLDLSEEIAHELKRHGKLSIVSLEENPK